MSFSILYLVDNLGLGGAQSMAFELYHSINLYYPQFKQTVIYQDKRRFDSKFVSSYGVPCREITDVNKICKIINREKDVVVIYHKLANSHYHILEKIKKHTKAKILVINHTLFNTPGWKNAKLDIMVSVSKHMDKKISKWYPNIAHCFIHNGVCGDRYKDIKPREIDKKNIFLTGRINRICAWKHSNEWLKWCCDVTLPIKMVHEYIGAGIGGRSAAGATTQKGRNKVKMLGGISDFNTKVSILKSWNIFLYETLKNEGLCIAILEAMACGVPVICSRHYGNLEIIKPGINGFIFKDKNEAKKILKDLINDRKKLKKLSESTKEYFDNNLDAKYMAKKYLKVISDITGKDLLKEKKVEIIKTVEEVVKKEVVDIPIDENPKFSILTSNYNKEKNLNDWAKSILCQKYRPLEVVFADDCSEDNSLVVIRDIKKKFLKNGIEFKLIKNDERLYCGSSYRNLTYETTGKYFGVLDADDMLEEGAVEYIMSLYKRYKDISWIYTQFLWCNEQMIKRKIGFNCAPEKGESLLDLASRKIHGIGTGWRTFSYKIKRPDKLFGRDLKCAVDKYMGYRLEEFGKGLFTNKVCYKHRGHHIGSKDSVSSTKDAMNMWKIVIAKAHKRRKKYNYKPYPIIKHIESE